MSMDSPRTKPGSNKGQIARQRLLEAAGKVFAEKGYHGATVREICRLANVNIATVNYYFRSKKNLYREVYRYAYKLAFTRYPPDQGLFDPDLPIEDRLKDFTLTYLRRIFDPGKPAWASKLTARELLEPSEAIDDLVDEIRPLTRMLIALLARELGPAATDENVRWCLMSIWGQCVFYNNNRPLAERLFPEQKFGEEQLKKLSEHITRFSLDAIRARAQGAKS